MDMATIISSIASGMTIIQLTYKFIKNLGVESTPELERKIHTVLETIIFEQTTENSLLVGFKKIPQLANMTNDHIKKQFEDIYNESTNSNIAQNINSNGSTTIQATGNSQIHIHGVTPTVPAQNNASHIKQPCIDFLECANTIFNDKRLYEDYGIAIELLTFGAKYVYHFLDSNDIDQGFTLFLGAKDSFITESKLPNSVATDVINRTIDLFPNLFKKLYIDIEPNEKLVFSIHSKNLFTQIDRNAISIHGDQITSCIDRLKSGSCDQYL